MKFTKEIIDQKLSSFIIPQHECATKAWEIVTILFDKTITQFPESRSNSRKELLGIISKALSEYKIVILWLDTGAVSLPNPAYRAIHCIFIYDENPSRAFAIWDTPGVDYGEENRIISQIDSTLYCFGSIGVHIVP